MYIAIIVISIILGLYLLTILVDVIFVLSFSSIMKKHDNAIKILINSKNDILRRIKERLEENNVYIDEELKNRISAISFHKNLQLESEGFTSMKNELSFVEGKLLSYAQEMKDDEMIIRLKSDLVQLNMAYRSNVIMYNADVLGYNYWIRFLPTRYIYLILKTKDKNLIS